MLLRQLEETQLTRLRGPEFRRNARGCEIMLLVLGQADPAETLLRQNVQVHGEVL